MFTIDILFSKWDCCCLYSVNGVRKCVTWVLLLYRYISSFFYIPWYIHCLIECFHSRGQHLCKFIGTKESVCIRKEFNSHRTRLGHQHGRRFIVLGHQHGRRDVMWKHSIISVIISSNKGNHFWSRSFRRVASFGIYLWNFIATFGGVVTLGTLR